MPGQSLSTPTRAANSPSTGTGSAERTPSAQDTVGNSAIQQQMVGSPSGQLSWEAALGETLGSKLYTAIADKLSDDELRAAAQKAVASATDQLDGFLRGRTDASEQDAAAFLLGALDRDIQRIAGNAVTGEFGETLRGFVDDNPHLVASAAVAAAVAYILSNQRIGMVDGQVGLGGGHGIVGGLDLGRTMDIAVERVRIGYRYQAAGTRAEVVGDYFTDDGAYEMRGRFEQQLGAGEKMSLSGSHLERGDLSRSRMDVGYQTDHLGMGAWWQRDRDLGVDRDTLGGQVTARGDDWSAYVRGQTSTDGAYRGTAGVLQTNENRSWGVEGFSGRDASGQQDSGVRAVFKWRF